MQERSGNEARNAETQDRHVFALCVEMHSRAANWVSNVWQFLPWTLFRFMIGQKDLPTDVGAHYVIQAVASLEIHT